MGYSPWGLGESDMTEATQPTQHPSSGFPGTSTLRPVIP